MTTATMTTTITTMSITVAELGLEISLHLEPSQVCFFIGFFPLLIHYFKLE